MFAQSAANIGDINGDGIADIAVGAPNDESGAGSALVMFLSKTGEWSEFNTLSLVNLDIDTSGPLT